MGAFDGVVVDRELSGLIGRMVKAEEYRGRLQALQSVWDSLTLLGHLSGTATDMSDTRSAFHELTGDLLNQLGKETLKKTVLGMKSKAQVAVDIMVRNLFERTADIGFLAMDDEIRDYLGRFAPLKSRIVGEDARAALNEADLRLSERFREYAQKYSVYSNIILLDVDGNVLLQLDGDSPVTHSKDALINESLITSGAYVETFRYSDLQPHHDNSLIYSYRVTDAEGRGNLGVLCLCFKFANEADGIFSNLVDAKDWSVVTLLDKDGRVIASSDSYHIPVGAFVDRSLERGCGVTRFAGREYLSSTMPTHGYQGYQGQGWCGHVMLPLDHAFDQIDEDILLSDQADALNAVMSNKRLFSDELRAIPVRASKIQRALNRSVWNGNVSQQGGAALNPAFSKILLWEISGTGMKTQEVFDQSISNLHQTVVSSILQDGQFQAALAIDIMDRNLYERANDCRWWALASVFRNALSADVMSDSMRSWVAGTLAQINGLYTVYDNLVVFDRHGCVISVSNPAYQGVCGQVMDDDWVRQTLALSGSQSYTASIFTPSRMYGGRHTYIYGAAIRGLDGRGVVGGIGLVFDSEPQFAAMLNDALPRDEEGKVVEGAFSVFADCNRSVIASTNVKLKPGVSVDLNDSYFDLKNGERKSGIAVFDGRYYGVGACMSHGYREYKGESDSYNNDVVALVFTLLGELSVSGQDKAGSSRGQSRGADIGAAIAGDSIELATFYVGDHWLGVKSSCVVEAIDVGGLTAVPGSADNMLGCIMYRDKLLTVVGLSGVFGDVDSGRDGQERQIIVLKVAGDSLLGVMVDGLGEIPEIQMDRIEPVSAMIAGGNVLAESLVKPVAGSSQDQMIVIISPERLFSRFKGRG